MDKRIGAQLYTVRSTCQNEQDFEETIKKLHEIGYKVIQLSGIGGDIPAERIREICDKYGMIVACSHHGYEDYENRIDELIEYNKIVGNKILGLGSYPFDKRDTFEHMLESIEFFNSVHKKLQEHGMAFAHHNHALEFGKYNDKHIMYYMLEKGNFDFIVDVYWVAYAGIDPAKFIKKVGKRGRIIHYKDLAVSENNVAEYAEIGKGNLDWDSIIEASADAEFALVEQDVCKTDPIECLKTSYDFLTEKGFE